jgi:alpha-N-arabinofuranosidase
MKKFFFAMLIVFPFVLFAQTAEIKIDVTRKVGEIDPKIYGVFMEPIHFSGRRMGLPDTVSFNTMYGNLYDPSSPLADKNGFRNDYIEAAKELKITNMRWPGGNFVMGYNWKDGIGPKDQRPATINLAWGGTDNNHVGTDEWVELNNSIGSENVVCVNLGLGTINDALHWVEYCNYKKGTYYSDLRAKYGHEKPYDIKIWDLGNEVDGAPWELGHKNAYDYVKIAREAAKAMRAVDNNIKFVASGSSYYESTGKWVGWNRKVLKGLGDMIDYISIHRYWENSPDYYTFMGQSAMDFEEKIRVTADEIDAVRTMKNFKNPIYISVDEWGTFGRNFRSVLPIAQCFNSFIRHADIVKMANFTMFTSLLSTDREKGSFKSPLFYTFKLFSNNCLGNSVDTYVQCDTFNTDGYKGIPYLDVTSVFSK